MKKQELTESIIKDAATCGEADYELRDSKVIGLVVHVYRTGGKTFFVRYRRPDNSQARVKVARVGTISLAQARKRARSIIGGIVDGGDPALDKRTERKAATWSDYLEKEYIPFLEREKRSGVEIARALRKNFTEWDSKKLANISHWHAKKWSAAARDRGLSSSSMNRYLGYARAALNRAVKWKLLAHNGLSGLEQNKEDNSRVRFLDNDELSRLLTALDTREETKRVERDSANAWRRARRYDELPSLRGCSFVDAVKPMILLSLNTGMRRGEVFKLEWNAVDLGRGVIKVEASTTKTATARNVWLNDTALATMKDWHSQTDGRGLVFPNPKSGEPYQSLKTVWSGLLEEAGITDLRWHDMRHHYASKLVQGGAPLDRVQKLLGHASILMTQRYSHLRDEDLAAAVRLADTSAQLDNVIPIKATK